MEGINRISVVFTIIIVIVSIVIYFTYEEKVKIGIYDCHSNPELNCYGVHELGMEGVNKLSILRRYYYSRYDSLRPIPKGLHIGKLTDKNKADLDILVNGRSVFKIKNHSKIRYKESYAKAYTLIVDSIEKVILIDPSIVKPINND